MDLAKMAAELWYKLGVTLSDEKLILAALVKVRDDDACRRFALTLPPGRAFNEFGGNFVTRLYVLKQDRDDLKRECDRNNKGLRILEHISEMIDYQYPGQSATLSVTNGVIKLRDENEKLNEEVSSLKRERDELQERETMRLLADNMPEATVPIGRKLLDEMRRERDALAAEIKHVRRLGTGMREFVGRLRGGDRPAPTEVMYWWTRLGLDAQQPSTEEA